MGRWIGLVLALQTLSGEEGRRLATPQDGKVDRDVLYAEPAGERLLLDVYAPPAGKAKRPAVVLVHGGGWSSRDKRQFAGYAERIAAKGFVGVCIDYRLAPRHRYPAALEDCRTAVRWVRANAETYAVDPERIGVLGSSAGGHLVSLLGTTEGKARPEDPLARFSAKVACVVNYFGPTDLRPGPDQAPGRVVQSFLGKSPAEAPDLYAEASPITHVGKHAAPFLVIQGTADKTVRVSQSDRFVEALHRAGVEASYLKIEGAGHGFHNAPDSEHARTAWAAAVEFLTRHLASMTK